MPAFGALRKIAIAMFALKISSNLPVQELRPQRGLHADSGSGFLELAKCPFQGFNLKLSRIVVG